MEGREDGRSSGLRLGGCPAGERGRVQRVEHLEAGGIKVKEAGERASVMV